MQPEQPGCNSATAVIRSLTSVPRAAYGNMNARGGAAGYRFERVTLDSKGSDHPQVQPVESTFEILRGENPSEDVA